MSTAPLVFNGLSSYSKDFQAILNRQVSIQQLPIQQLQNEQADLLQKKAALIALSPEVSNLGASINALSSLASSQGLIAASSNASLVSVVNTGGSQAANYTISNITSLAAPASETSLTGSASASAGAVSSSGTVNLIYGAKTYPIVLTPATNNLNGLAAAINKLGVGANASVLNTGTGGTPYYLTLSASAGGQTTLKLQDVPAVGAPVDLLSTSNQGTNAAFDLNGIPVSKSSNVINDVAPGLTFTLLATTAVNQTAHLSLTPDGSGLSNALQTFADNYNALVDQVNGQIGAGAGPLAGDSLIYALSSDLQQLGSYHGSASVKSLADLGLTFDSTGKISLDTSVAGSFSSSRLQDAFKFLGSSTSGFGSLATAFTQIADPSAGIIQQQESSDDRQNTALTDRINTLNSNLALFQANLTSRLTAADVAVSELQNQLTTINSTVQGLDSVLYGKQTNSNGI
jgi:flagellar hook-associated protein 2